MTDFIGKLIEEQQRLTDTKAWIQSKHAAIWGYKGWDTQDEGELTEAAVWWLEEHDSFVASVDAATPYPWPGPTLEQHESVIFHRDAITAPGPENRDLKGTRANDKAYQRAVDMASEKGLFDVRGDW